MRLILSLVALLSSPAMAQEITSADLTTPTDRYDHAVLGDALEWAGLRMTLADGRRVQITLPDSRVFEDITARLADLDDDGLPEVLVVETDLRKGASLAIYSARGKQAATDFIGQPNRWMAPAGWGDFDGDGRTEIAYIDRPHLAKELVFLRLNGTRLTEIARAPGYTNHRIGDSRISGGTRRCNGADSLIVASADWTRALQVTLGAGGISATDIGPWRGNGPNLTACP